MRIVTLRMNSFFPTKSKMADEVADEAEHVPTTPVGDVNSFVQRALSSVLRATKSSRTALPSPGDDFDYYTSFAGFREFAAAHAHKIVNNMNTLLRHEGVEGEVLRGKKSVELDDRLDTVVEANDIILERVGSLLDEASGVVKQKEPVLPAGTPQAGTLVSSWNKKSRSRSGSEKSVTWRLLHARNIERPQLKFKDKIDNSNTPFIPIIRHKPNALRPLPKYDQQKRHPEDLDVPTALADFIHRQREAQEGQPVDLTAHPYQYELEHFQPTPQQLQKTQPQTSNPIDTTPLTLVTSLEELMEMNDKLSMCSEFAVDLEHHSYRSFQGFTCLMQVSTRDQDYIVDTLTLRADLHILNDTFTDPKIVKVFHGADMDIQWLQRDFGVYVVNMFDTGQASHVLGLPRHSLAYLLKTYCDVEPDKKYQLADWRIRPIPSEMIQYAREDTHYLLHIYDCMRSELLDRGNNEANLLHNTLERSRQVCLQRYQKLLYTEDSYLNLLQKHKKTFNSQQLHAVRLLYRWRDTVARQEDESTGYILPNHMLLVLAEALPKQTQGVFACCNPVPPLVRQHIEDVHRLLVQARDVPIVKTESTAVKRQDKTVQDERIADLYCPHDLSKLTAHPDVQILPTPVTVAVKKTPSMFGEGGGREKDLSQPPLPCIKPHPDITLFDTVAKTQKGTASSDGKLSANQEKVARIMASFTSPFEKKLPFKLVQPGFHEFTPTTKAKVKSKINTATSKQTKSSLGQSKDAETEVTQGTDNSVGLKRSATQVEEEAPVPLSEMGAGPKKKKKKKKGKTSDTSDVQTQEECTPSVTVVPEDSQADNSAPTEQDTASKPKKKRKAQDISELDKDFQPFDYSKTDMSVFNLTEGKKKKKINKKQKNKKGKAGGN
ncbi:PREDICTED: exosome component 10-like [Branchiostoma belcheri]|uniref:Exosome complex component 10 n=1 Tax=Branchiostoma belcheri TaxID=7741 RepID=A0A6P4Z763_BRABE|nr:PREDICTED: exosome component 10-like [Branchiostoma belcheri]